MDNIIIIEPKTENVTGEKNDHFPIDPEQVNIIPEKLFIDMLWEFPEG